jgi:SNF2 family DNA or RNA helicase
MASDLADLMLACGVLEHPAWFSSIPIPHWPMPHQMEMAKTYPHHLRYLDAGEPGVGKTYPAQIHAILMAALGNKVVFTMPPKLIRQFIAEFEIFFPGVSKHLNIAHLDISAPQKTKLITKWEAEGWPDILCLSYDGFRQMNAKHGRKKIGANLWRIRDINAAGTKAEFATTYYDLEGKPRYPKAQAYTPDGRQISVRSKKGVTLGTAENPKQLLLFHRGYHVMFFDEAHALCGMDSQISESVNEIVRRLGDEVAVYLMTGTPIPTHLHDVYGIIRLVNPKAFVNRAEFLRKHCITESFRMPLGEDKFKEISNVVGYADVEGIHAALWKYASRVQKRDVIQMPEPLISQIRVKLEPAHLKLYKSIVNDYFAMIGDNVITIENPSQARHVALQVLSSPEQYGFTGRNAVAEACDTLLDSINPSAERKVIIFAYYRTAMEFLAKRYESYRPSVVYGGSASAQEEIDRFKTDPDSTLMIINWISGGAGLNLQVASHTIFYECPTSPKDAKQAIARTDRKGQLKVVNAYFLRAMGTLSDRNFKNLLKNEESNNRAICDKHDLLHELMGNNA